MLAKVEVLKLNISESKIRQKSEPHSSLRGLDDRLHNLQLSSEAINGGGAGEQRFLSTHDASLHVYLAPSSNVELTSIHFSYGILGL